ncbi:membrane protein insertase YidC [candidate division WOR-3 bacterium]|uniref:Membrane protein insertase YidC n=1 Tax=candidate division WOR-3 bacterium TaxID=2052148 RepID=A0A9D5K8P6_UNCW3|nr:membrane protein insertase YidC [candidate division WOR-3 bacterium]MBD3364411.1 membrane protein insertase YidC [candidate division WOR-3 bacterium]
MEQRSGMSTIIVVILLAAVMILFFVFGGKNCAAGSGGGFGCGGPAGPPPVKDTGSTKTVSKPIMLTNEKIKVRLIPSYPWFRIDQVELIELKEEKELEKLEEWEDSTKFNMRIAADTTGTVPVRLLDPTLYIVEKDKPVKEKVKAGGGFGCGQKDSLVTNTHDTLTWDEGMDAPSTARLEEKGFNYTKSAGFEVYIPKDGRIKADTFWTESRGAENLVMVWEDSLGSQNRVSLKLEGYEVKVRREDNLGPGGLTFNCKDGLARTEPHDRGETSLYRLYYGYEEAGVIKVDGIKSNYERKRQRYLDKRDKGKDPKNPIESGPYAWIGLRNKYFAAIIIPDNPVSEGVELDTSIQVRSDQRIGLTLAVPQENSYSIYFGPQDYFKLGKIHKELRLRRIVEMGAGWYRWLSEGILLLFNLLNKIIGNYGVVIIVFALLVKVVFLPLSRIQHRSTQKMQILQPKLKELQERYKDDPKRLNEETMRLYRNHKASPFGGCLPLLIQLPVFFGLYGVLRNTIALRGAEFVKLFTVNVSKAFDFAFIHIPAGTLVWLADLSIHDPFYILPVLMGVASVIQSLRSNIDPRQRTMTLIMPIFITVIFLNFPSGLQLYWLFFNILSIIEYTVFRRGVSGGTQWQKTQTKEIPSGKSSSRFSRR